MHLCPKCGEQGRVVNEPDAPRGMLHYLCNCGVRYAFEHGVLRDYTLPEGYKGRKVEAEGIIEVKMGMG